MLRPDREAVGGLVEVEDAHRAPGVEEYLSSHGS